MLRTLTRQSRRLVCGGCPPVPSRWPIGGLFGGGWDGTYAGHAEPHCAGCRITKGLFSSGGEGEDASGIALPSPGTSDAAAAAAAAPLGRKPGEGRDLMMVFTCTVCDTRAVKTMSRKSYESGVVIVTCPGCQNRHLIADRLGWFGEPGSIENYLAERGEAVFRGQDDGTLEIPPEVLAGLAPPGGDGGPHQQQAESREEDRRR